MKNYLSRATQQCSIPSSASFFSSILDLLEVLEPSILIAAGIPLTFHIPAHIFPVIVGGVNVKKMSLVVWSLETQLLCSSSFSHKNGLHHFLS